MDVSSTASTVPHSNSQADHDIEVAYASNGPGGQSNNVETAEQGTLRQDAQQNASEGRPRNRLKKALWILAGGGIRAALVNSSGSMLTVSRALGLAEKLARQMPDHANGASQVLRHQSLQAQKSLDVIGNSTASHIEGAYAFADKSRKAQTQLLRSALELAVYRVTFGQKKPQQTLLKCAAATKAEHLVKALEFGENSVNSLINKANQASGFLSNVCEDTVDLASDIFWKVEDISNRIFNDLQLDIADGVSSFFDEVKSLYEQAFDWGEEFFDRFQDAVDSFIGRGCQVIQKVNNNWVGDFFVKEDGLLQWCENNDYLNRRRLDEGESFGGLNVHNQKAMLEFIESFEQLVDQKTKLEAAMNARRTLQSSGVEDTGSFNNRISTEASVIQADIDALEADINADGQAIRARSRNTRSLAWQAVANKTAADDVLLSLLSTEESTLDSQIFPNENDRRQLKADIEAITSLGLPPSAQAQLIRVVRSAHYHESGVFNRNERQLSDNLCDIPSIGYVDWSNLRDKVSVYTDPDAIQSTIDGLYNKTLGALVDDAIPEEPTKLADSTAIRNKIESKKPNVALLGETFSEKLAPVEHSARQNLIEIISHTKKWFDIAKVAIPFTAGSLDAADMLPKIVNDGLDVFIPFLNQRFTESMKPGLFPSLRAAGSSVGTGKIAWDTTTTALGTIFSPDKLPLYALLGIEWLVSEGPSALETSSLQSEASQLDKQVSQMLQTFNQDMQALIADEQGNLDLESDAVDSVRGKLNTVYSTFKESYDLITQTPGLKQIYDFMLGACDFEDITGLLNLDVDPDKFKEMSAQFQDIYNNQLPQANSEAEQVALFTQAVNLLGNAESAIKPNGLDYSSVFKVLGLAIVLSAALRIGARHTPTHRLAQVKALEELPTSRRSQRDRRADTRQAAHMLRVYETATAQPASEEIRQAIIELANAQRARTHAANQETRANLSASAR